MRTLRRRSSQTFRQLPQPLHSLFAFQTRRLKISRRPRLHLPGPHAPHRPHPLRQKRLDPPPRMPPLPPHHPQQSRRRRRLGQGCRSWEERLKSSSYFIRVYEPGRIRYPYSFWQMPVRIISCRLSSCDALEQCFK